MVKISDLALDLEYDGSKPVPRYWTFNWQISKIIQMSNKLDKNIGKNKDLEKTQIHIKIKT